MMTDLIFQNPWIYNSFSAVSIATIHFHKNPTNYISLTWSPTEHIQHL